MKLFLLLLIFLAEGSYGYRVVCVYTNWSQYRAEGGKFLPEDVDAKLCTHVIYVYAKLKGNRLEPTEWNDEGSTWSDGMFKRVNNLKQINHELKTLLGVGGWMMGSKAFSKLAASRSARRIFAKTSVKFLRDKNFDGLTIDWQHPTKRGGRPKDKVNFSLLLKEIRQAFEAESKKSGLPPLLLTAGVSASREIIGDAYEIENVTKYTDFLNVMAYDLHGAWDNYTGHPSQLYAREEEFGPSTEINVDSAMRHWISNVSDRSKLVLGISTYGRTFTLRKARHNDYSVPTTGPGDAGDFTQQPGMLAYYERCSQYADAPRVWDVTSQVAYWYSGNQWIAGEDVESVKAKVNWTRTYEIGGMMVWSLDTDDFADKCQTQAYALLNTVVTDLNDPTFVKANVSVERLTQNVEQKLIKKPRKIKQQTSSNTEPRGKSNMAKTMATNHKKSLNIQAKTKIHLKAKSKNKNSLTDKDSLKQVNGMTNDQHKNPQQNHLQNIETKQKEQAQEKNKPLLKADMNKNKPEIKPAKQKRRVNQHLRRKVLMRKQKNRKNRKNRKNLPNKAIKIDKKTHTQIINHDTKVIATTGSIGNTNMLTTTSITVKGQTDSIVSDIRASKSSTNKRKQIDETGTTGTKLTERKNPNGKQEREKAKRVKSQIKNDKIILADVKTRGNHDQTTSSVNHIIVHDKHMKTPSAETRGKNDKNVVREVRKTIRIASKRKQAPIRILRRKIKRVKTSARTNKKGQNKASQRSNSVVKKTKSSRDKFEKTALSMSTAEPKHNAGIVSPLITRRNISKQTTPVIYTTTVSTTSSPVQSKVKKPVIKQVRRRKGKALKIRRRLKRRRKKGPKASPSVPKHLV